MNARGTRRPHSRKPRGGGRVKGGKGVGRNEAPGCLILTIVGFGMIGVALAYAVGYLVPAALAAMAR